MANWPGTVIEDQAASPTDALEQPLAAAPTGDQYPGEALDVTITDTGDQYDPADMTGQDMVALEQQGYVLNPQTGYYELPPVANDAPVPEQADNRTFLDNLNRHLASVRKGLASIDDLFLGLGPSASNALFGTGFSTTPQADKIAQELEAQRAAGNDYLPRGEAEQLIDKSLQGVGAALPLAAAGVVPAGVELAAGGLAGLGGEYARQQGAGEGGQLAASVAGAMLAPTSMAGAAKAAGAFGKRAPNELMQAFERQQVPALPADVAGPTTRRLTAAAAQAPLSASPVIKASERVINAAKAALSRTAAKVGSAENIEGAGQAAARGARAYIKNSRSKIGRVYDTAAGLAGDIRLPLPNAKRVLDEQIASLSAVPGGGSGLGEARALRAALDGEFTVQGIRDMRTEMFIAPEFRGTPVERRMRQIVDAAAEDIEGGLIAAGKTDAARAFATADRQWKERLQTIKRVIEPIIGRSEDAAKSGEEIVKALNRAMSGNGVRAEAFIRALPEDEAAIVRASIIDSLGSASAGQQNAAGDVFSLSQFLTDWNKIGERAKSAFFGGESRAALNDLAKIAEATKGAQKYANTSNTSGGIWGNLGILASGATVAPVAFIAGGATQLIGGRLLSSPRFARWLASAPAKTSRSAQLAHIDQLTKIAASQPIIANDILALQERLAQAIAGPSRAAATEGDQPED